jgi:hypothetical protein
MCYQVVDKFTSLYSDAAVEILAVGPGISTSYGDHPHLARRVAAIDIHCPLTASDCVT